MYKPVKRVLGFLLALAALIALSPLLLAVCAAVRLGSRGPALFAQKRFGAGGSFFTIYKFRTMRQDAPENVPTHLLRGPDAYITPVGAFLRRTSLDELPQLFNILIGDMAFVGPRPALYNQYDLISEREKYGANAIAPGLTGLAQVMGRDELSIAQKAAYDGEYAKNLSFILDVKILLLTLRGVVTGTGVSEGTKGRGEAGA